MIYFSRTSRLIQVPFSGNFEACVVPWKPQTSSIFGRITRFDGALLSMLSTVDVIWFQSPVRIGATAEQRSQDHGLLFSVSLFTGHLKTIFHFS